MREPQLSTSRRLASCPEALSKQVCIAFDATTPIADRWSFHVPGGKERTVSVRARLIVNSGKAAIDAAAQGLGIVRALSYQVDPLVADKKLSSLGSSRLQLWNANMAGSVSVAAATS